MQRLTVNIQDGFIQDFLAIIDHYKDKIQLEKDENLIYDPYFYERQKQLKRDIDDIDSGKIKMLSQEEYDKDMSDFLTQLKLKYAN